MSPAKKKGRTPGTKVEMDGHLFASKKEASIYLEFKADPKVKILGITPLFPLLDGFTRPSGEKVRPMVYTADFLIRHQDQAQEIVVEVKSKGTAKMVDYQLRRKLFLAKYTDYLFLEIILEGKHRTEKLI
ncbi:MAG: hypothetical protein A2600_13790 [Candidatus Lambdaproteobacteria bacterium RIFOXYD1_FULL_56_27]|uniref:TnsA endonuclease N-terminal domain-containing protein n=1 Tax=Candidatus Lambdaproteobacteria bacterium RIFOXYD2_FULL_56_26 TaxID=1817773 RepID=A0A1F6GLN8_9PROT|nr:MAG: hypothetical protein A2557_00570 [Candidatus Lambdaproteobacteria bacterium RIFOXYD2_FULL_56_26]OGH01562.1 MAG: hypothetical protein A2426_11350 [Candidatus Lambdaproteobacteria bacterium RIFOXYC1_FULL_56_13]OGH08826.1 MAG: hypothetical protein A2600_13790 [Candidatus Lambdaproteobacteria bacterium RIFOXYD1_FULL_56_27]